MPTWKVELYELHSMEWTVKADNLKEAVQKAKDAEGTMGTMDFVEDADLYGYDCVRQVETPEGDVLDADEVKRQMEE